MTQEVPFKQSEITKSSPEATNASQPTNFVSNERIEGDIDYWHEHQFMHKHFFPHMIQHIKHRMQQEACHSAYTKVVGLLTLQQYAMFLEGNGECTEIERPDMDYGIRVSKPWKAHKFYNPKTYDNLEESMKIPDLGHPGWYEFHLSNEDDASIDIHIRLMYISFFWSEEYEELQYSMRYEVRKKDKDDEKSVYIDIP